MTNIKKKIVIVFTAFCVTAACAVSAVNTVHISAFADGEKEIESISYNEYEAIVAGQLADIRAEVTFTDGTTELRPIHYTAFPVDEMTTPFHSFYAEGYVEGFDEVIGQNIIVVPDKLQYMIDLGSNYTL